MAAVDLVELARSAYDAYATGDRNAIDALYFGWNVE